jgi:redox-sensitive bicupin YhaK (pirin superfamily)
MSDQNKTVRETQRIITSHKQLEGGGFVVRRPVPGPGLQQLDPFLLIDEMGPVTYAPGEAVGAPDHPHRGFETVTYALEGEFEHADSAGHRGKIRGGDVQWMTAGAGIVHAEMPSARIRKEGGVVHGFQIWVNLPARLKMTKPRYQEVEASRIPAGKSEDGLAKVRVVTGSALGVSAVIDTHTPIVFHDWTLEPGADVTTDIAFDHNVYAYVFGGAARVGNEGTLLRDGELAVFAPGDAIRLRAERGATTPARLLILGGVPISEPVARYGPFVMNTQREIQDAVRDYQAGKMGKIAV